MVFFFSFKDVNEMMIEDNLKFLDGGIVYFYQWVDSFGIEDVLLFDREGEFGGGILVFGGYDKVLYFQKL